MAGVTFNHPAVGVLNLRHAPTSVQWTYNLNTSVQDTFAGQVIQLLSINYDRLIIEGKFGLSGPHGRKPGGRGWVPKRAPGDNIWAYGQQSGHHIGLTEMTHYFEKYFSQAGQPTFNQQPMRIQYEGNIDAAEKRWRAYPVSFPSYKRSWQDFAPEWRVEFEVEEADNAIHAGTMRKEISRLRKNVGYRPNNKFSDPFWATEGGKSAKDPDTVLDKTFDHFKHMVPAYSREDLDHLIYFRASLPKIWEQAGGDIGGGGGGNGNVLQPGELGEIGHGR